VLRFKAINLAILETSLEEKSGNSNKILQHTKLV